MKLLWMDVPSIQPSYQHWASITSITAAPGGGCSELYLSNRALIFGDVPNCTFSLLKAFTLQESVWMVGKLWKNWVNWILLISMNTTLMSQLENTTYSEPFLSPCWLLHGPVMQDNEAISHQHGSSSARTSFCGLWSSSCRERILIAAGAARQHYTSATATRCNIISTLYHQHWRYISLLSTYTARTHNT